MAALRQLRPDLQGPDQLRWIISQLASDGSLTHSRLHCCVGAPRFLLQLYSTCMLCSGLRLSRRPRPQLCSSAAPHRGLQLRGKPEQRAVLRAIRQANEAREQEEARQAAAYAAEMPGRCRGARTRSGLQLRGKPEQRRVSACLLRRRRRRPGAAWCRASARGVRLWLRRLATSTPACPTALRCRQVPLRGHTCARYAWGSCRDWYGAAGAWG